MAHHEPARWHHPRFCTAVQRTTGCAIPWSSAPADQWPGAGSPYCPRASGVWEGYVHLWVVPKWLLPAPSVIAMTLVVSRELLFDHTLVTLLEVVVGFGLSLL